MRRKRVTSPARRLLLTVRGRAEERLVALGMPSNWPACLDLLDTHQTPAGDATGQPLFYSREEVTDTAQVLYQTYRLEHWLKENDAERAAASTIELIEMAVAAGFGNDLVGTVVPAIRDRRRQQVRKGDLRWWRRVAAALRKRDQALSSSEIAKRIDPMRYNTIRKYL
jgi:hypothetical protein